MTGRSGLYYGYNNNPFSSDSATYTNNRRIGWSYNAEGQLIATPSSSTDSPRNMSYDAAGRMITTIEFGQFNTVTYSAGYDGDGQLGRESSTTSPSSTETSYIVRSTALGGEVLTRLDQSGNKKTTHVPAEGLLFATQRTVGGASVLQTYRNPLGTTETGRAVYDPLGNYIPFQQWADPRPPAGSYNSAAMSSMSSSQANPHSYAIGCIMDGLPTSCTRVMNAINRGQAQTVTISGTHNPNVALANAGFIPQVHQEEVTTDPPIRYEGQVLYLTVDVIDRVAIVPGGQRSSVQNPQNPAPGPATGDCARFADRVAQIASGHSDVRGFVNELARTFIGVISADVDVMRENANNSVGERFTSTGFRADLFDNIGDNQARHFMGGLIAGYNLGGTPGALVMNHNEDSQADLRVNGISIPLGAGLTNPRREEIVDRGDRGGWRRIPATSGFKALADAIRNQVCAR